MTKRSFFCWSKSNPEMMTKRLEADSHYNAAVSFCRECWQTDLWDGDSPACVSVKDERGVLRTYRMSVEIQPYFVAEPIREDA